MEGKSTIEITMALGIQNENILFHRADKKGLYLGIKENYKKLGEYTGELVKICENESPIIFYTLHDIITNADKPEVEKVIKLCYYLLQQEPSKIENIYNWIMGALGWQ